MDLLLWLQSIGEYPKIYWKERESKQAFAGAGIGSPSKTSYAWRHFSPSKAPHWADFPKSFSFSPRLENTSEKPSDLIWKKPSILSSFFLPDLLNWRRIVERTLQAIEKKELKKCVLARECLFKLDSHLDLWPLVSLLEKKVSNSYLICIQPTPRSAFISFTPERLFLRQDRLLSTEALAGTQKQGALSTLAHPKYQREFSFVEESIKKALSPLEEAPSRFSPVSLCATSGLEHLRSSLETKIKNHVSDKDLLERLHPTAALLGYPKSKAWKHLRSLEPFDRGLYGAPLGRISGNTSEWVVGIRSCLLFESTIRLYSGAGLVEGSDAEEEWKELDHKLHVWKELF